MLIHRGYRYELNPNNRQRTHLAQHAGCSRFAYNWGLEQRIKRFREKSGKDRFTTAMEQHRELNKLKRTSFPWMYEVSKCALQEALRDLERAFQNFWRGLKTGQKMGFPRFKKKGHHDSFRLYGTIKVFEKAVQLPRLGRLRIKEKTSIQGRILSATVSCQADHWFVSFCTEQEIIDLSSVEGPKVGVDLGLKSLATLSDGTVFENPRPLKRRLRKLRSISRRVSRRQKGSQNWRKAVKQLARLHLRISNIRRDTLHKLTTYLAKNHRQIIIEELNVEGMKKKNKLSRAIADVGWGTFRRQLEYKTRWYGSELVMAPPFFPSSKMCSQCGNIKEELSLGVRVYVCEECRLHLDRDLNAAANLVAASWVETKNACLEVGGCRSSLGSVPADEAGTEHHFRAGVLDG